MAPHYAMLFLVLAAEFTSGKIHTNSTAKNLRRPRNLVTRLIYSDSIYSPSYNSSETISDRAERAFRTSLARVAHLSSNDTLTNKARTMLAPSESDVLFYVNFSIGQPSIPQLAIMDTASAFTWLKCIPCTHCLNNSIAIFDPSKSSSYTRMSCENDMCNNCNDNGECIFEITYVSEFIPSGILAIDQLTFDTPNNGKTVVGNAVFGCAHNILTFGDEEKFNGVFGLGEGNMSLTSKLDRRFSYCIGNLFDPEYGYNEIAFAEDAILEGDSTTLHSIDGIYHVSLIGISVGGEMLAIHSSIFAHLPETNSGVTIDTGIHHTFLVEPAYVVLKDKVDNLLDGILQPYFQSKMNMHCYIGKVEYDLLGFPVVTFHFDEGAELALDPQSMFHQVNPEVFCMAVYPSSFAGYNVRNMSTIGMMAQQYYNIGYDLHESKLYLQRIECELLD